MLRYLAAATVVVLAAAVAVTSWIHPDFMKLRFAASKHTAAPQNLPLHFGEGLSGASVIGNAPWALSALPDCFRQTLERSGRAAFVRAGLPPGAQRLLPGVRLRFGPCTISVGTGEVTVQRGSDRLRIPPYAELYRADDLLVLIRTHGATTELRSYDVTTDHR